MLQATTDAWTRASARERRLVVLAALVVLGGAAYAWAWQPMSADTARLARDLPRERAMLAAAQAQAADLVALAKTPAAPHGPLGPAIERALAEHGVRPDAGALDDKDGRVRVNLAAVRFDALVPLLDALARSSGVRVIEATVTQRVEPGQVRAELVLGR